MILHRVFAAALVTALVGVGVFAGVFYLVEPAARSPLPVPEEAGPGSLLGYGPTAGDSGGGTFRGQHDRLGRDERLESERDRLRSELRATSGSGRLGVRHRNPAAGAENSHGGGKKAKGGGAGDGNGDGGRLQLTPGAGTLSGAALTAALESALEADDLATLQGLLISELTLKGTQLTAEDVPVLLDALVGVEDYGMQKLLLTHLDRIEDAPPELVDGYFEYLEGARSRSLGEEVLDRLVKIGGDDVVHGLTELVQGSEDSRFHSRAIEALGKLKDPRGIPVLSQALTRAESSRAASPYLKALATIGGKEALTSLADYVSREGNEDSLRSLYGLRDPAAGAIFADRLNGRVSESFQRSTLKMLRSIRDPSSIDGLSRFLTRAKGDLARDAIVTLWYFRDARAAQTLERYAARQPDDRLAAYARKGAERIRRRIASGESSRSSEKKEKSRRKEEKKKRKSRDG